MPLRYLRIRNKEPTKGIHTASLILTTMGAVQIPSNIRGRPFPFARNRHRGIDSITLGRSALTVFRNCRRRTRSRSRSRILPATPPLLAPFAYFGTRQMIILPAIHYRCLRWSAVLTKGGIRRWRLNKKTARGRNLNWKGWPNRHRFLSRSA